VGVFSEHSVELLTRF